MASVCVCVRGGADGWMVRNGTHLMSRRQTQHHSHKPTDLLPNYHQKEVAKLLTYKRRQRVRSHTITRFASYLTSSGKLCYYCHANV